MKPFLLNALLASAALLTGVPAQADPLPVLPDLSDTYIPQAPADDALYRQLGGEAGVQALVAEFHRRTLADRRVAGFFAQTDHTEFKKQLALELCSVSGGPCVRPRNIKRKHAEMDISKANFHAVVENLQQAMDTCGIAFSVQNRLLAQLAPMHRDIVNVE